MRNKYGIGFFVAAITAIFAITCAYQLSFQKAKERAEEARIEKEMQSGQEQEESVAAEGTAEKGETLKKDCYYLMEVNGYIVVYLSDKTTPYEYTDIQYDELPDKVRQEIRYGKYIEDEEALYGFLENYSS